MVHKVTMDTVRVITSSVSGMTNVSEPRPPAPWACADGWSSCLESTLPWARGHGAGSEFSSLASPILTTWNGRGALIFQLPELLSFKI